MNIVNFKISFIYKKTKKKPQTHEIDFCWHFPDMYAEHYRTLKKWNK